MSLLGIGWYFAVCIIGGVVGGLLLDNWLDTGDLFKILGLFLGLGLAFYGGFKILTRVLSESATKKGPDEH